MHSFQYHPPRGGARAAAGRIRRQWAGGTTGQSRRISAIPTTTGVKEAFHHAQALRESASRLPRKWQEVRRVAAVESSEYASHSARSVRERRCGTGETAYAHWQQERSRGCAACSKKGSTAGSAGSRWPGGGPCRPESARPSRSQEPAGSLGRHAHRSRGRRGLTVDLVRDPGFASPRTAFRQAADHLLGGVPRKEVQRRWPGSSWFPGRRSALLRSGEHRRATPRPGGAI